MSNMETAQRFANLVTTRDLNGLQDLLTDDFVAKGATMELNKQQMVSYLKMMFIAFPDLSFGLTDFEETGDMIHCASHEQGTHDGILDLNPFGLPLSLPPTGKHYALPKGGFTFRVTDDKVAYLSEEGAGLKETLVQLGVKLS